MSISKHILFISLFALTMAAYGQQPQNPLSQRSVKKPMTVKPAFISQIPVQPKPSATPSSMAPAFTFASPGAPQALFISKTNSLRAAISSVEAQQFAYTFLETVKEQLQVKEPASEFKVINTETDDLGQAHTRMQQVYHGVNVYGAEIIVHHKAGESLVNGNPQPTYDIDVTPAVSSKTAVQNTLKDLGTRTQVRTLSANEQLLLKYNAPLTELVIYPSGKNMVLAWHITVRPNVMERWEYFVDAASGAIVHQYNNTCHVDGPKTATATDLNGVSRTINTYQIGSLYYMIDASRAMYNTSQSSLPDDPVGAIWTIDAGNTYLSSINHVTSSNNTTWSSRGVSAQYNAGVAYDYYKNTHNRNSINGQGGTIISVINVSDDNGDGLDNAFWNGQLMAYGNGKTSFKPLVGGLDVAGHEMTHGVVQNTANLEYQGQSGAINESMADIFGCMMDRNDWLMGEDVVKPAAFPSGALRSLQDPHNGGSQLGDNGYQPRHMTEYYKGTADNGGVHINSGIPNYAFYKYATAITKNKAELVYYRALKTYLTKSSQFIDLRLAVIQAAKDLYGSSGAEVTEAANAFDAVGIYGPPVGGGGTNAAVDLPVNPGADFILSYDTDNGNPNNLYKSSTTGSNFQAQSQTVLKRRPSVLDDGSLCLFIDENNTMKRLLLDGTKTETTFQPDPIWDNVAVSKDGKRIAAITSYQDTGIYVYDFDLAEWRKFTLYNPTYSDGVNVGGVLYADALEWDNTGTTIIYDAKNRITNNSGDDIEYWDVGRIKVWDLEENNWGDGKVEKIFSSLPEGISIGNPSYSKNSPYIIAFDYIDLSSSTADYAILGMNILTNKVATIFDGDRLGYPCYSKNDDKVVFNNYSGSFTDILSVRSLNSDKITGTGSTTDIIPDAQWGVWYATGKRSLLYTGKDITAFSFQGISPPATGTISGTNISVTVGASVNRSSMVPTFTNSAYSSVKVAGQKQISGVNDQNFTNPVIYTVTAQDGSTKSYTVTVTQTGNQDIADLESQASVSIYPNPTNGDWNIQSEVAYTLRISDLSGKIVYTGQSDAGNLLVSASVFDNGIYIAELQTAAGTIVRKLIKQ